MNILNLFNFQTQGTTQPARLDPTRDWIVLLIGGMIALTGIVVWNAWAFDTVAGGGTIGNAATSTEPVFSQASLDAVHTIFENRALEESKYVSGVYMFTDPSQ
ncbi:MAG: hypothetical protein WCT45_03560 [Candidatus Paceibacterota bacterium]|jgi:hypothetical protein